MKAEKQKLLSKVAYMHFVEGKSQSEIAESLGIYRTTISRMIKQAKEQGIVEITIKDFDSEIYALESYIKEKYNMSYISIVPVKAGAKEVDKDLAIAKEAATIFKQKINRPYTIGISWGSALGNAIACIESKKVTGATFVPIVGGPSHINSKYHVNTLVYELARKFGGESLFINATVVQETKKLKEGIINSKYFEEIRNYWKNLDIAFVGIGGPLYATDSHWRDLLTEEDNEDLDLREAVGDCCCRFFDQEGEILTGSISNRTIGLSLQELKQVPEVIGVARSVAKSKAILAALKKQYIKALISDEETMIEMLRLSKDPYYQIYMSKKQKQ